MKLNKKRILSLALAGVMALGMAVPALAADQTTTITATYAAQTMKVTVPVTGNAIINPYGLPFKLGEQYIKNEPITTGAALTIQNKSAVAIDAQVDVTVTVPSGITLTPALTAATAKASTNKELVVSFEAFKDDTLKGDLDKEVLNKKFVELKSANADLKVTPNTSGTACNSAAPASNGTVSGELILKEGTADGALQAGGAAFFRLSGFVAQKPNTAWATTDSLQVEIAWTFVPTVYPTSIELTAGEVDKNGFSGATVKTDALPEGTEVSDPANQVTITQVNKTNAGNDLTITAPSAAAHSGSDGWDDTTRVYTANITAVGSAAKGDKIEVTIKVEADDGTIYKGTTTITVADSTT